MPALTQSRGVARSPAGGESGSAPVPAEVLRKVRLIEISTRRLVNTVLAGQYHSAFKGQGVEVAEVREYVPGDDVRAIDWNVTARMGHPFVKVFSEERELSVVVAVDISGSSSFGTGMQLKREIAAEIAALLAFSALRNNDRVGLLLFSEGPELFLPPKKGRKHGLNVIRQIVSASASRPGTRIGESLQYLHRLLNRRTVVFLLSDFLDTGFERPLRALARRHDVLCLDVADRREWEIPPVGLVEVEDPETGARLCLDTSHEAFRRAFAAEAAKRAQALTSTIRKAGADYARIDAAESYDRALLSLFHARQRRKGR